MRCKALESPPSPEGRGFYTTAKTSCFLAFMRGPGHVFKLPLLRAHPQTVSEAFQPASVFSSSFKARSFHRSVPAEAFPAFLQTVSASVEEAGELSADWDSCLVFFFCPHGTPFGCFPASRSCGHCVSSRHKILTKTTALIPALTGQRQEDLYELKASLVSIMSSQLAGATYRDPVLGKRNVFLMCLSPRETKVDLGLDFPFVYETRSYYVAQIGVVFTLLP